ncbi:Hypp3590 [Branchiostoma lanceolatum]|uniref:Hypp3590 protein n=1 Tax=Branchiostoma lanceolatum TaxID=7740 RepID=A0A8K0A0D9_BRALA|nr:Hypp3590 [Branchiostoma lanceolatum]
MAQTFPGRRGSNGSGTVRLAALADAAPSEATATLAPTGGTPSGRERGEETWGNYQSVLKRLIRRYIHHYKARQTNMIADDIIAEMKQDISSLRFEMREYRRKDASREVVEMQLLRDVTAEIRKAAAVRRQTGSATGTAESTPAASTKPQGAPGAIASQGARVNRFCQKLIPILRDDLYRMLRQTLTEQVDRDATGGVTSHPLLPT